MKISTIWLLHLIVVCTYARSFSAVDIPDPPQFTKDSKGKVCIEKETRDETTKASVNSTTQHPATTKAPTQHPVTTKAPTQHPTTTKAPTQHPTTTKAPTQPPTTTKAPTQHPTTTKTPTQPPTTTKPPTQPPTTTTKPPTQPPTTTQTTTLDPWNEFCKEACEEGLAGPECDCPEHPIGRRSVGKPRHRRSTFTNTQKNAQSESMTYHSTSKAKPTVNLKVKRLVMEYCELMCAHGIDNNICKCSGVENLPAYINNDLGENTTQNPSAAVTTKDPLVEFCETACAEGEGSLACNCHDHIVGRRRRSVKNLLGYPEKVNSGQHGSITHLDNTLPRVKLNRDSVHPQDLSVQFAFRTAPKANKADED